MARVVVTGAAGMIGSHLVDALLEQGERDIVGTAFRPTVPRSVLAGRIALIDLDIRDRDAVHAAIATHRPATVFHLAAQSLPTVSWADPWDTFATNVQGTINLFEAIRALRVEGGAYDPIVVVACSSAEYGASLTPENLRLAKRRRCCRCTRTA
jgi:nucleoside-diphosphate-sugar epimerase